MKIDDGMKNYGKPEKLYLGNTNLIQALSEGKPEVGNIRETFFLSQMQVFHWENYSSENYLTRN